MIKIYYDKNLRLEAREYQTFPLLQQLEAANTRLSSIYQLVDDLDGCDIGMVPMNLQYLFLQKMKKETLAFIERCKKAGKEVLVFSGGDYGINLNIERVHTIRLGGFHSKMNNTSYIMPPFIDDPYLKLKTEFVALQKSEKPTVGFVGHSNGSLLKYLKEFTQYIKGNLNRLLAKDVTDYQSFYPSSVKRHHYLSFLSKLPQLDTNFIYRKQYRAGVKTDADKEKTTVEFYQNMYDNQYTFCLRGTGNFSVRFYETLAMGRIPVMVDTNCRLPFNHEIDWTRHCVIVRESEVRTLGEKIIEFNKGHSNETFIQIQKENRGLWKDYFRRDSYFAGIARILEYH